MGVLLSRFDRESVYANYEKAFTKLEQHAEAVKRRSQLRTARRKSFTRVAFQLGAVLTVLAAVYASWVQFSQGFSEFLYRCFVRR